MTTAPHAAVDLPAESFRGRALDRLTYVAEHRALDALAGVLAASGLVYAFIFGVLTERLSGPAFEAMLSWAPGPPSVGPLVWGVLFAAAGANVGRAAMRGRNRATGSALSWLGGCWLVISVAHIATWLDRPAPTGIVAYLTLGLLCATMSLLYGLLVWAAGRPRRRPPTGGR